MGTDDRSPVDALVSVTLRRAGVSYERVRARLTLLGPKLVATMLLPVVMPAAGIRGVLARLVMRQPVSDRESRGGQRHQRCRDERRYAGREGTRHGPM
jgi:hypothetical protein